MLAQLRRRAFAWVAARAASHGQGASADLSSITLLPSHALMPLRRTGLDPVDHLDQQRTQAPVARLKLPFGVPVWLITGYDECRTVLGEGTRFSTDFTRLARSTAMIGMRHPGGLGFTDPPDHTRLRKLLTPHFTMRRLETLRPRITAIVDGLLDDIAATDGPVDLWTSFALPVPSLTICELLGVPYADRILFQQLSTDRFDLTTRRTTAPIGTISDALTYLEDLVARQRREPGAGLLGTLIREHGDSVTDEELTGLADGILTGGLETTASMLALGTIVLLRDPTAARIMTSDDDSAVNGFVEELLRYLTVVQAAFPRFALEDITVGGVHIAAGDAVVCSLSAANRDPAYADNPSACTPRDGSQSHLAFGHGIHRCVGAELARLELRYAYPALLRRFPNLRLAVEPDKLRYRQASIVYGVSALPVHVR